MPLLNSALSAFTAKRLRQIEAFRRNPVEVQQLVLRDLLHRARNTEWGRQYGYADMLSAHMQTLYAERLPVQDYEGVKPYVERLRKGESNLLWPSQIRWFSKSSGTTSDKSKFIPVSKEALDECHYLAGKDVLAIYNANHPHNKVVRGKMLALGGSHEINDYGGNARFGDVSAVLIQNMPLWAQWRRTPNKRIALMAEWEEKLEKMAHHTLRENVSSLAGVPSWTLVLLKRIREITGAQHMHEVWPNLEVFIHGGVSFRPYREQYDQIIDPKRMRYMETYNASEGFFAMQDDPSSDDMLLMLDYGVYYEFVPMDEFYNENPRTLHIGEVETGVNYAMLISSNAGLWRYVIGDTVKFSSLYPHKIKITGRTRHFINAFGEELIVDNAERALAKACEATGAIINEYTGAPIFMTHEEGGGHEWIIEFAKAPDQLDVFVETMDQALQQLNSDYEAKRYQNKVLQPPTVHAAPQGTFMRWMEQRGKLGGQNKVPRLSNGRDYVNQLLELMN